jgi:hypothetical protein
MSKRKDKGAKGKAGDETEVSVISVAAHPRSASAIRRAKGFGGLAGALLATGLALSAHLPLFDAMLRGLAAGVVGYIALWALAVTVARQLVIAEVRARYAEVSAAAASAAAEAAEGEPA